MSGIEKPASTANTFPKSNEPITLEKFEQVVKSVVDRSIKSLQERIMEKLDNDFNKFLNIELEPRLEHMTQEVEAAAELIGTKEREEETETEAETLGSEETSEEASEALQYAREMAAVYKQQLAEIEERIAKIEAVKNKSNRYEEIVKTYLPSINMEPVDKPTTKEHKPIPGAIFEPREDEIIDGRDDPMIPFKLLNLQTKLEIFQVDRFEWGNMAFFYIYGDLRVPYMRKRENPEDKDKGIQWRDVAILIAEYCNLFVWDAKNFGEFMRAEPRPNQKVTHFLRELEYKLSFISDYHNRFPMIKDIVLCRLVEDFGYIIHLHDLDNAEENGFFPLCERAFFNARFPKDIEDDYQPIGNEGRSRNVQHSSKKNQASTCAGHKKSRNQSG
ncbi:uncharacterized protein J8A68_000208 [[Candida] subhashii]|uniref:Uncharacterized protein n=1 Tax=[Candida] subhashii TaxID=561895 RepID=A0A8J5QXR9_9ASCO|nr:uncharacterized protein J8A68_000208 [[Candida] subhashii]KAG7666255.1 hypothetical protein J8A68_000208 [[Candida] subhashii]